jgi:paraquat-inducible protein A
MDDITTAPGTRPELDCDSERSPSRSQVSVRRAAELSHANGPSGLRTFLVGVLIIGATACLVLGLTMPVIELTYFYVWSDTHSFISIVRALFAEQEIFLAGILVIFSMLFPAIKLVYLLVAYTTMATGGDARNRALHRMSWLGKWSMLDVLVLALVIFYVKSSALTEATALPGVYFFAGAVLMTMIAYALVEHSPSAQYR